MADTAPAATDPAIWTVPWISSSVAPIFFAPAKWDTRRFAVERQHQRQVHQLLGLRIQRAGLVGLLEVLVVAFVVEQVTRWLNLGHHGTPWRAVRRRAPELHRIAREEPLSTEQRRPPAPASSGRAAGDQRANSVPTYWRMALAHSGQ